MSGAGTFSGVTFQSKLGALALVSMLTGKLSLKSLRLTGLDVIPDTVALETEHAVDDIIISTVKARILVQAKTDISISDENDSTFSTVIEQLVRHDRNAYDNDECVLAVSQTSPATVRDTLKGVCDRVRLNPSWNSATANQEENRVHGILHARIVYHFNSIYSRQPSEKELARIIQRFYVRTFDAREDGELAAFVTDQLSAAGVQTGVSLLDALANLAATLGSKRNSITREAIRKRYPEISEAFGADCPSDLAIKTPHSGREYVLLQSGERLEALVHTRFTEDGKAFWTFDGNAIRDINGRKIGIARARAGTHDAFLPLLESYLASDSRPPFSCVVTNIVTDKNDNYTVRAILRSESVAAAVTRSRKTTACIVCGRAVSERLAYVVEIDSIDLPWDSGIIHTSCRMGPHRVIGYYENMIFEADNPVTDFDLVKWVDLKNRGGSSIFTQFKRESERNKIWIEWNHGGWDHPEGIWAIKISLENSETIYFMNARGGLWTSTEQTAIETRDEFISLLEQSRESDPLSVNDEGDINSRSRLIKLGAQTLRTIEDFEIVPTSSKLLENFPKEPRYAPLVALETSTGQSVLGNELAVLLTNPLTMNNLFNLWEGKEIQLPEVIRTRIIETDSEFDAYVARLLNSSGNIRVLVDPVFIGGKQVRGFEIVDGNSDQQ